MRQLLEMLPLQANVFSRNGRAIFVSSIVDMQSKTLNDLSYSLHADPAYFKSSPDRQPFHTPTYNSIYRTSLSDYLVNDEC